MKKYQQINLNDSAIRVWTFSIPPPTEYKCEYVPAPEATRGYGRSYGASVGSSFEYVFSSRRVV